MCQMSLRSSDELYHLKSFVPIRQKKYCFTLLWERNRERNNISWWLWFSGHYSWMFLQPPEFKSCWCTNSVFFNKMGHFRPLFLYFRLFYKQLTVNKCSIKVANDWIQTRVLWYRKRPLSQLRHNHCPHKFSFILKHFQNENSWKRGQERTV